MAKTQERKVGIRGEPPPSILIVCEGVKTEPNYFKSFRISSVTVKGLGKNTKSLVETALALKSDHEPDRCWCVFDRDSFPADHVNEAHRMARDQGCQVAFSNECFELWYLLHFDFIDAALSRARYSEMLTERLGSEYKKNDEDIYGKLLKKQGDAIRNARLLLARHSEPLNPARNNPVTTVHLLVEELNRYRSGNPSTPSPTAIR